MANVSQQIPNFLGGVSQASDIQKATNEVDDIINGYPDATYGLIKRPGSQWLYGIDNITDPFDYHWFTINSSGIPYLGCVGNQDVRIWNTLTGDEEDVTVTDEAKAYLAAATNPLTQQLYTARDQFEVYPLEKGTILLNKYKVAARSDEELPDKPIVEVSIYTDLPDEPVDGTVYKILNTPIDEDNYWVEYISGAWKEVPTPKQTYKLDPTTLPHGIINLSPGVWAVGELTYADRLVGSNKTVPFPSFVGKPIKSVFAYMNRIGFLAGSNVIMSQPLTPVNDQITQVQAISYFGISSFTVSEADPVDISVASVRDVVLFSSTPGRQGIVLFGDNEQFLLYSTDRIISPSTAQIRSLSTWEMNNRIDPVELDSEFFFVTGQAPLNQHARLIKMVVRGMEEDPLCTDVSKDVAQWIPSQIYQMQSSTQEQFVSLVIGSNNMYFYRYFKENGEVTMKAWFRWRVDAGEQIIYHSIINGNLYLVLKTEDDKVNVLFSQLTTSISNDILDPDLNDAPRPFLSIKPNMDLYTVVDSSSLKSGKTQVVLNNDYPKLSNAEYLPFLLLAANNIPRSMQYENISAGYGVPMVYNSTDSCYETRDNINLTSSTMKMVFGFLYRFRVDLPTLFYRGQEVDYVARLNIARCKFECSAGLQGALAFQLRADGYPDFDTTFEVTNADMYDADNAPLVKTRVFEVPINKQNLTYTLKAVSDSPFPVALNSMTWEGNYSPRFYRRL